MHFIIHWEPKQGLVVPDALQNELLAVLKPYSWFRPFTNFYVVQVSSTDAYQKIQTGLVNVANRPPVVLYLLISPPMTGGRYNGVLPQNNWAELNSRST